jgi:hypothetical protein
MCGSTSPSSDATNLLAIVGAFALGSWLAKIVERLTEEAA